MYQGCKIASVWHKFLMHTLAFVFHKDIDNHLTERIADVQKNNKRGDD